MNTIAKWGNSLAVRIPSNCAEISGLKEGTPVRVSAKAGRVVIERARPEYKLKDLLARVTPENFQGEVDWGAPAGAEEW
jgi:antitoxin MazE